MVMEKRPEEPSEETYATADVYQVMQKQVAWVRKTCANWIKQTQQAQAFASSLEALPPLEIQESKAKDKEGPPKKKCKTVATTSYKDSWLQAVT